MGVVSGGRYGYFDGPNLRGVLDRVPCADIEVHIRGAVATPRFPDSYISGSPSGIAAPSRLAVYISVAVEALASHSKRLSNRVSDSKARLSGAGRSSGDAGAVGGSVNASLLVCMLSLACMHANRNRRMIPRARIP